MRRVQAKTAVASTIVFETTISIVETSVPVNTGKRHGFEIILVRTRAYLIKYQCLQRFDAVSIDYESQCQPLL